MMRNGIAYPRLPLAPLTKGTASSSSPNWPTPTATLRANEGSVRLVRARYLAGQADLAGAKAILFGKDPRTAQGNLPALLPTPLAGDYKTGPNSVRYGKPTLSNIAAHYPTPTARDWRSGNCSERTLKRHSLSLPDATACREGSGQLNPGWVEHLMGFPIGWTASSASATPSSPRSRSSLAGGFAA
jgi:hypothetical protein